MSTLVPQITDQDLQLLRRVFAWSHANDWQRGWSGPTWQSKDRLTGVQWDADYKEVGVCRRPYSDRAWPLYDWHPVTSVRQAIDLLVYLEVLPLELSSAYEVGAARAIAACSYHPVGRAA